MKRILTLLCTLAVVATATAQTLRLTTPRATYLYEASRLSEGTMRIDANRLLTIDGFTHEGEELVLTLEETAFDAATITVDLNATNRPVVTLPGRLAGLISVAEHADRVEIVAAPTLAEELTYRLTGRSSRSVIVRGSYKSTLVLDNLYIDAQSNLPALWIDNGKRIDIHLPEGTSSTLADRNDNQMRAACFVKGHAEWKGAGTITLTGRARHAYASNEYTWLRQSFGTMNIASAASDGLHVRQYFQMDGGRLTIKGTAGDGIDVERTLNDDGTPSTDELNGQVVINGGNIDLDVTASDVKGIKSQTDFTLSGGIIQARVAGNGSKGISVDGNLLVQQKTATPTRVIIAVSATTYMPGTPSEAKARGIKVDGDFTFDGGDLQFNITGAKAKAVSIDGNYIYRSGTTNALIE